jgi:hypothetical protein
VLWMALASWWALDELSALDAQISDSAINPTRAAALRALEELYRAAWVPPARFRWLASD